MKKTIRNPKEDWLIFENTHEPIVTQLQFDLMQELRKNKRRPQRFEEINPFSGVCYCADCGKKMYLCRSTSLADNQEHLKCSTYANATNDCSAHYIRTSVLNDIVLGEVNKLLAMVKENEEAFVQSAMESSATKHPLNFSRRRKHSTRLKSESPNLTVCLHGYMRIMFRARYPMNAML